VNAAPCAAKGCRTKKDQLIILKITQAFFIRFSSHSYFGIHEDSLIRNHPLINGYTSAITLCEFVVYDLFSFSSPFQKSSFVEFVGESPIGKRKALSPPLFFRYFTLLYPECQEFFHSKLWVFIGKQVRIRCSESHGGVNCMQVLGIPRI
jgi:hypothetical protein